MSVSAPLLEPQKPAQTIPGHLSTVRGIVSVLERLPSTSSTSSVPGDPRRRSRYSAMMS